MCLWILSLLKMTLYSRLDFMSNSIVSNILIVCAISVAHATPAIPILNTTTNSKSSPILVTDEIIKKYNGFLLSPTDRRIPLPML